MRKNKIKPEIRIHGKIILLILAGIWGIQSRGMAQEGGIRFETGTWEEVKEKAMQEEKLIFADFYTQWCGPCLMMAEEVFPLLEVGNLYNAHFVNVKIDAEEGEGKMLREKYGVVSYPAFLFIDPRTEEVVHRSSSRQEKENFLFTGRSALFPELRSAELEKRYAAGEKDRLLLARYMDYLASVYQREKVRQLVEEYKALPDFSLENRTDWEVFVKHVEGIGQPPFRELMAQKEKYEKLYGQEAVEGKLFREFNVSLDLTTLQQAPEFRGKAFLLKKNQAEFHLRKKEYEAAIPWLEALIAEPDGFGKELCHYLKFTARSVLYGEHPAFWIRRCAEYAQYVAYNHPDRQDAGIHYDYALILEKLIRQIPEAGTVVPESILHQPARGAKAYSLRPAKLKPKRR